MAKFLGKSVIECYSYFRYGRTFAPYFTLVQSSGTGKTTCIRLIENLFPTRYVNLGKKDYWHTRKNYSAENKKYDANFLKQLKEIANVANETKALRMMKKLLLSCTDDLEKPLFFPGHEDMEHLS